MLSNILSIIEETAREQFNQNVNMKEIYDFFQKYRKGMWIYPDAIKRKFSLTSVEVYNFLIELEKKKIIEGYYELYCTKCSKSMGIVKTINEIPDFFECEICHDELLAIEHTLVIYKVIQDG